MVYYLFQNNKARIVSNYGKQEWSMSNAIFIFGASGFIGSHIWHELIKNGERVIPITRHEIDLENSKSSEQIKNIIEPRSVVVLAAARSPAKTADDLFANMTIVENCINGLLYQSRLHIECLIRRDLF